MICFPVLHKISVSETRKKGNDMFSLSEYTGHRVSERLDPLWSWRFTQREKPQTSGRFLWWVWVVLLDAGRNRRRKGALGAVCVWPADPWKQRRIKTRVKHRHQWTLSGWTGEKTNPAIHLYQIQTAEWLHPSTTCQYYIIVYMRFIYKQACVH